MWSIRALCGAVGCEDEAPVSCGELRFVVCSLAGHARHWARFVASSELSI